MSLPSNYYFWGGVREKVLAPRVHNRISLLSMAGPPSNIVYYVWWAHQVILHIAHPMGWADPVI
jgi:hypothetical protein